MTSSSLFEVHDWLFNDFYHDSGAPMFYILLILVIVMFFGSIVIFKFQSDYKEWKSDNRLEGRKPLSAFLCRCRQSDERFDDDLDFHRHQKYLKRRRNRS
jgi:hypothetical protein